MPYEIFKNVVLPPVENSTWKKNKIWYQDQELRKLAKLNGQVTYMRSKPCRVGHVSERYVANDKCLECSRIGKENYKINTPVEKKRALKKKHHLKQLYSLSLEKYERLVLEQNNLCKLCNKPETAFDWKSNQTKRLAVDHCHDTNKIRGLLCSKCNQAIGLLKHNSELLRKAALYCE